MADEGGRGGSGDADKGERGGLDPPFLADIICEQPLTSVFRKAWFWVWDTDIIPQPVFSINFSITYSNKTTVL